MHDMVFGYEESVTRLSSPGMENFLCDLQPFAMFAGYSRTMPLPSYGSHAHFEQRTLRWYNMNDWCMACCRTTRSTIAEKGIARGGWRPLARDRGFW